MVLAATNLAIAGGSSPRPLRSAVSKSPGGLEIVFFLSLVTLA
jgi:hypothetical protein